MSMTNRFERITERIATMSESELETWRDSVETMTKRLFDLAKDAERGDLDEIRYVHRQVEHIRRDQMDLDDPLLSREMDSILGEVMNLLNNAETESRQVMDEENRHLRRCQDLGRDAKGLADKFKRLESRR